MARKTEPAPLFGAATGPGFGSLRTAAGGLVAAALTNWRAVLDEHHKTAPDDNLGWLRTVYLVPSAIGRTWQQLQSVEAIYGHNWDGKKKCRLKSVIQFDGQPWASTSGGPGSPPEDVSLTQLLTPEFVAASLAGGMHTWPERQDEKLRRTLGSNFFAVGPVYPKTGDEQWALGYNVRVIPVEGLALGQWFKITLPPAPKW
jgi:hypothetical protein